MSAAPSGGWPAHSWQQRQLEREARKALRAATILAWNASLGIEVVNRVTGAQMDALMVEAIEAARRQGGTS